MERRPIAEEQQVVDELVQGTAPQYLDVVAGVMRRAGTSFHRLRQRRASTHVRTASLDGRKDRRSSSRPSGRPLSLSVLPSAVFLLLLAASLP